MKLSWLIFDSFIIFMNFAANIAIYDFLEEIREGYQIFKYIKGYVRVRNDH